MGSQLEQSEAAPPEEMTCAELVELVTDYFEGVLPTPELVRFEHHIAECPPCTAYLEQMRQTIRVLGRLTEHRIDSETREVFLDAFRGWRASQAPE